MQEDKAAPTRRWAIVEVEVVRKLLERGLVLSNGRRQVGYRPFERIGAAGVKLLEKLLLDADPDGLIDQRLAADYPAKVPTRHQIHARQSFSGHGVTLLPMLLCGRQREIGQVAHLCQVRHLAASN